METQMKYHILEFIVKVIIVVFISSLNASRVSLSLSATSHSH